MEKAEKRTNQWLIKMLAVLAICVLLLAGLSLLHVGDAVAAEKAEQTLTLSDVTVNRGQEFDVDIDLGHNGSGIQAIRFFITFDPTAMTLLGVTPKDPVENENWMAEFEAAGKDGDGTYNSYGVKRFALVWVHSAKRYGEGTIATLRFLAKPSAIAKDYQITVTVDPDSTLLAIGQKRDLNIEGGVVTMLPGARSVLLYAADGKTAYAYKESPYEDATDVTIEAALLKDREGLPPSKDATTKYTYTFRGWEEVQGGNNAVYKPTYTATPIKYDITFKKGYQAENTTAILYDGEHTSETVRNLPYSKIVNYDAEIPGRFSPYYTFLGWYLDEACETPVDFVVMPDRDITVYGYYKFNVDEPGVTTTALNVTTSFVEEAGVDYLLATVNVVENYGINSIRFAPAFDSTKLEFVGFLYEQDSPFFSVFAPVFPEINDAVKGHQNVTDTWQLLGAGESINEKYFLFLNENENVFTTGKLITFKYKIKTEAASGGDVGVSFGDRDLTRFDADEGIYYANAHVTAATVSIRRVVKPTAFSDKESYVYDPQNAATYVFETKGGENYYELSGETATVVGDYAVTATLKEEADTLVTWEDGTKAPLTFDYEIVPFTVTKPVAENVEYVYNGTPRYFAFTAASKVHSAYYTITGDEETAAGTYSVTVSLDDKDNFVWEGDTTEDLDIPFVIKRLPIVKPTAYTAEEKTYSFNPGTKVPYEYNNDGVAVTYVFKAEDNASKAYYAITGNSATAVGAHTVTVTLTDTANTEWADGNENVDVDPLEYPFVIGKYAITTPTLQPKTYIGEPLSPDVTLPVNSPYFVTPASYTEIGIHDVTFTILAQYASKYEWVAPVSEGSLSAVAGFEITGNAVNEWVTAPYVTSKTYDGTPAQAGAMAKYGDTINVLYRLQSATDADYSSEAPVDSGAYFAKFSVPAGALNAYTALESDPVPFEIYKVRLNKPTAFTAEEKTYTYSGEPLVYVFKQAGNAEIYDVTGNVYTDAGSYTVTVSIKEAYRTNYIWKGATASDDTEDDQTYPFVIGKAQLVIPVPTEGKTYVYNGEEQSFEFSVVEYSDRYTILNNKQRAAGVYTVIARIESENKKNYEWVGGSTDDQTYPFEIRRASVTASTANDEFTVTISSAGGFAAASEFTATKAEPNVTELLATIASATKVGALGQLTAAAATEAVADKCFVASICLGLDPAAGAGEYDYHVLLSVARVGVTVLRIVGDNVEVFAVQREGDTISFDSDTVGDFIILADHSYVYEVAAPEYLIREADCDEAALYYKSCSCGKTNGTDTFEYGEPLGHDYDMDAITWAWSGDHLTATAKVVCRRDATHVLIFKGEDVTVEVVERVAPGPENSGKVVRRASITYKGETYTSTDTEILPAGHVFTAPTPIWRRIETPTGYAYKATFICDCGETSVVKDATVTVDVETDETKIIYNATVDFQGVIYPFSEEVDRPYVSFDFDDGTHEVSIFRLPGESVPFLDNAGHVREGYIFIGWREEGGTLIVKNENGEYIDYKIGVSPLHFIAEWKKLIPVHVSVVDTDDLAVAGATVGLYENDVLKFTANTTALGEVTFNSVPTGNYKLVVTYPYKDGTDIVRSSYLDVIESADKPGEGVDVTVVLPKSKFNTVVEGDGSSEGLENAISEEEKNAISDGTVAGTVNEIVITQKRSTDVSEEIKERMNAEVRLSSQHSYGTLIDFYSVTMIKTVTSRNPNGDQKITQEIIKEAENYQTNIFPISTTLREQIAAVNGTVDNIFVYKRHDYGFDIVAIFDLPKFSEAEGERAQTECFFIKRVGGEEYIAVRQREYSELAFGVSPDPILLTNSIDSLSIEDWTFGESAKTPEITARYGASTAVFTYATEKGGEYTATVPTTAGTYYLKAVIPATSEYAGAMKADIPFTIHKKKLTDVGNITFEDGEFWFNGKPHSIYINGDLPEGVTVEYVGNEESDLGKFTVTAVFVSENPNYDVSDPMTAVMHIRLNWIPILILIVVALLLLIIVIVIVEKLLKAKRQGKPQDGAGGGDPNAANSENSASEEGSNND